nr:hypothetical protein BaRGS_014822 [Batillaria attramentaria]
MVRTSGGEGINIHSIDVLLAWAEHGTRSCSKELVIEDDMNYRWDIQCGHVGFYGFRTIYTRPVHNVTLTLKSSTGNGAAYIWLQTRATETEDKVEIYCGEPLRQLLIRLRQEVESRHRNDDDDRTTPTNRNYGGKNSTFPYAAHVGSLTSNLAAIIGGIVAAGFVLISIVIIAIAFHCRRMQLAKKKASPINLYPAVTNGETTNLTSYCRYDYDDDHYSSINRSPLKMSSLTDTDIATSHARTNGFVTLATAEAHPQSPREHNHVGIREVVQPIQHSPPSARDPLLNDPAYNGHLSLRFSRPAGGVHNADIHDGHKTLPDNRSKILVSGPKSPLGKRSKSVTFSQPVAMVTPLPSGSEESMGEAEENLKGSPTYSLEDGNYDNLNKVFIPDHPLSPTQIHTVPIQRPNNLSGVVHKDVNGSPHHQAYVNSLPRSMSTFRAEDDVDNDAIKDYDEVGPYNLPPPPPHIINGDTYAVVHKPKAVPVYHPQRQNAQLYETGV